jgi:hypothetical protein
MSSCHNAVLIKKSANMPQDVFGALFVNGLNGSQRRELSCHLKMKSHVYQNIVVLFADQTFP